MQAKTLLDTWWKPFVLTLVFAGLIVLLGKINIQTQEMGIPTPFWSSSLGHLVMVVILLTGLIAIGSGRAWGWNYLAATTFIMAQWNAGPSWILPTIGSCACLWTWMQWKKRGWFKNFSKKEK